MTVLIKVHKTYRGVVAISDEELVGKIFYEGERQLDIRENFYRGEPYEELGELVKIIKDLAMEDSTFNIVGKESVNAALKAGIISKEGIKTVDGIPYALVLL
ncbi:DUF424 domain-containing protein [Candidatus Pacearchaeota archaeon CG10_big_fil_rev_8_21_14_0_10_35_13]|nr:MAG: DUF424 domain-containing protein [Candidatus Pacearchaeota archaeon CG10_big_fil_rev_8_21_14_0_10_35_13]